MHLIDFASGSLAGACGVVMGYPLETVRVRIQTQKQFTGIWQCTVATFSKEGVHGFFKGMSLPLSTISLTSAVVFGTNRNCLQCLNQARGADAMAPNSKLDIFLSGMVSGIVQTSVLAPGDMVKVRLQCQTESKRAGPNMPKPKYLGPIHCLLSIIREEGFLGLYRGILPLILRDAPSFATYFSTYSMCSELFTPIGRESPDLSGVMLAGGVAGIAGWTVATPMDVIKSRLQVDGFRGPRQYRGFIHCLTDTLMVEGVGVFYRSLHVSVVRAFPVGAAVFGTYEVVNSFFRSGPGGIELPWGLK